MKKRIFITAGYNTIALGTGRKEFNPKKTRPGIEEYVKSISNTGKIEVDFHPHPEEKINTLEDNIQMELFKIIQELMTNTLKHANAKRAGINLNCFDDSITLLCLGD